MLQHKTSYSQADNDRWHRLIARLEPTLRLAAREFRDGYARLSLAGDRIPAFEEVNTRLQPLTGWVYRAADGEVSKYDFLAALADRVFLAEVKIRSEEEFDFCKLPDIFHDVYGHAGLLAHTGFADFLAGLGRLARQYRDEAAAIDGLANIYWYTAEVGVLYDDTHLQYYGGSIVSSVSEINTVYNPAARILPYTVYEVLNTGYNSYDVNDRYFYVNDLYELNRSLEEVSVLLQEQFRSVLLDK